METGKYIIMMETVVRLMPEQEALHMVRDPAVVGKETPEGIKYFIINGI